MQITPILRSCKESAQLFRKNGILRGHRGAVPLQWRNKTHNDRLKRETCRHAINSSQRESSRNIPVGCRFDGSVFMQGTQHFLTGTRISIQRTIESKGKFVIMDYESPRLQRPRDLQTS